MHICQCDTVINLGCYRERALTYNQDLPSLPSFLAIGCFLLGWSWLFTLTASSTTVSVLQTKKYADVIIPRGVDNMGKRELGSLISLGRHLWGWEEGRRHTAALSACSWGGDFCWRGGSCSAWSEGTSLWRAGKVTCWGLTRQSFI